ncbi:type IV pilus modification PilV family protein [Paenibacillus apiarius]|uniref:Prepilin-type N-terminal cleavage/methylation domain-containing protein n=1 Tax=Paenibacillus apiarius TaxID=46240 RepID=A0ABT4DQD1_9BACL|nr:prepilin-type N-terminal cleavage/methylation domain-containing protein [Paenibacillus apiarius]MBN3526287.1 prepilin-type N-terminal cleavage/methylation domain-containing protein [Paenibacillus apiarius]MCY9516078.1 prepilin-type N-terminal cleavage/methylation domain-containing protein [Paenibacillus apiarius]MCY9518463.1 prepilin-type N-terminal cleavage/methylation domain-containing protein [Paenibacillus apiarius]MCY9551136.1 prepilin-type N-terminal cleavage/methylation domain-contain
MFARLMLKRFSFKLYRRDGLTLVEVLAAVAIFSMLLIVFITLSGFVQQTDKAMGRSHEAVTIAESFLHQYRSEPQSIGPTGITRDDVRAHSGQANTYQVTIHPLQPYVDGAAPASLSADHQAVVQSIVYMNESPYHNRPMLLTVSVTWEES